MDAFLGSAATLAEAASRGLPFIGRDINPLAVLLGQVVSAEAAGLQMQASVEIVTDRARTWTGSLAAPDEPWCRKWFRRDVAEDLTALRASIAEQPDVRERRMLWAAMAEIVRVSGNHLAGAPKLQTRPSSALARPLDVIGAFATHARRLARQLEQRRDLYEAAGWYRRPTRAAHQARARGSVRRDHPRRGREMHGDDMSGEDSGRDGRVSQRERTRTKTSSEALRSDLLDLRDGLLEGPTWGSRRPSEG